MNQVSLEKPTLQFLGGAGTVTGSKYLISYKNRKILVDCGLFQGLKNLRLKNWEQFPLPPEEIDTVILTHAHLDHSGYLPKLIQEGFKGKVYSTLGTKQLCEILLTDSGYLMEEEAKFLNLKKVSKHTPALPLYTLQDAKKSMELFQAIDFNKFVDLGDEISFEFRYAGHILGAAGVFLKIKNQTIFFSGDVGRQVDPIFHPPQPVPQADYIVVESTYGNRLHQNVDPLEDLSHHIKKTFDRHGVILVPAFTVGRAQTLMYYLSILKKEKRIPNLPIYLNSPMATDVTNVFHNSHSLHKLSAEETLQLRDVVKYVHTAEESKALNEKKGPMLIISASGMLTGGRILHHLKAFATDPKNLILLTGFQAPGTRGEALVNGAIELKVHGQYVPIKCEVESLDYLSAHADYNDIIKWFKTSLVIKPKNVFITHGEASASDELRRRLTETFAWNCTVPAAMETYEI